MSRAQKSSKSCLLLKQTASRNPAATHKGRGPQQMGPNMTPQRSRRHEAALKEHAQRRKTDRQEGARPEGRVPKAQTPGLEKDANNVQEEGSPYSRFGNGHE